MLTRSGSEESSRNNHAGFLSLRLFMVEKTLLSDQQTDSYVALARKYRPKTFEDLLGQDALVQTLKNAIQTGRLHHAYILTGIRGVGKTTTARLIARALNCTGLDGKGGPTIHPCGECENCKAIENGRHMDVLELDAASRTGVDDMRELLSGVQYKPVSARYKIYIIDEVHMLSKGAFNALLKTLEEPPAHVKFIFATTEIRKVPVTILSRCQRFDLQRLSVETLESLFKKVLDAENITADIEALQIVAKAADGSARDGLSMLDQAIVLGNGKITYETVSEMIGLADRNKTLSLFENMLEGDMQKVLSSLKEQYQNGADPNVILKDLIEITHMLTLSKVVPQSMQSAMMGENERNLCEKLSHMTSMAVLSKIWQMMIKGLLELFKAPSAKEALEMLLIRIAYSANLPTPAEILEDIKNKAPVLETNVTFKPAATQPRSVPAPVEKVEKIEPVKRVEAQDLNNNSICSISDLTKYLEEHKKLTLLYALTHDTHISSFENGHIKIELKEDISSDFLGKLKDALKEATGVFWKLDVSYGLKGETLSDIENNKKESDKKEVSSDPLVRAVMKNFPDAKLETVVRTNSQEDIQEEQEDLINTFEEEE